MKMREILCRGKQIYNGKWIEGVPIHIEENTYPTGKLELVKSVNYDELDDYIPSFESDEVIPETVGQYTGLTDKNGVKIFEGDILEALNGNRGYVVFEHGAFMKSCNPKDMPLLITPDVNVVIGNIHDNPELLKQIET